jgi:hypothetical protein
MQEDLVRLKVILEVMEHQIAQDQMDQLEVVEDTLQLEVMQIKDQKQVELVGQEQMFLPYIQEHVYLPLVHTLVVAVVEENAEQDQEVLVVEVQVLQGHLQLQEQLTQVEVEVQPLHQVHQALHQQVQMVALE